ncbi:hypothetical protein K503DRAFT_29461 [Rhizopogon vinicolor AM-OR11-026]|uniref:DUF4042 domain-containing protein n=1 Tax=Rhizopogon vinicolor AM-OR11-026 TaxID=1314800 RepID=A0A1B7MH90_9AGAM|nr:hypothetical protein K503DRAFT_29461 [Rhizopogon vinicolor AM-OR11-026]
MFTQQRTISSVVICSTAFGVLSYLSTILISVSHPDSPFHTAGSSLVGAICKSFLRARSTLTPDVTFGRSSAIRWILETSTNSEVVETAAAMIPRLQWPQKLDASTVYARLLDNYAAYANKPELSVTYGKAIAHLLMQSVKVNPPPMITYHSMGDRSRFIRDAFMDARLAWDCFKAADNEDVRQKHKADARTALRTMLVHGLRYRLSFPDNEKLIWDGDLRWQQNNGLTPCSVDFDWLIDYLLDKVNHSNDYEAEGDALLALSAMHGLGSSAKRSSYVDTLVRCMDPTRPRRVRYAAFRAVSDAGDELASITNSSTSQSVDPLDKLSRALLPAIRPDHNPTTHDGTSENSFEALGNRCYLRLIFALAKNEGWCERLTRDGHIKWCISLVDQVLVSPFPLDRFYLAVIFLRIDPSGKYISPDPWRTLIKSAWNQLDYLAIDDAHIIGALPALVTATRQNLPDAKDVVALKELTKDVNWVLRMLKEKQGAHYQADDLVDAALLHVQGLYDELSAASLTVG